MKASIDIEGLDGPCSIDLDRPMSIGIPLDPFSTNPSCFYASPPTSSPLKFGNLICSVREGAPVNFYDLKFVPHGNGTHTECVGHISPGFEKVNDVIKNPFLLAHLITVTPSERNNDRIILPESLKGAPALPGQALVIRTQPNNESKKSFDYTGTNPPYLHPDAMSLIFERGYKHLLIDLPSVDKEEDDGKVENHKRFWNFEGERRKTATITELIYVPNFISDGLYVLNLNVSNFALDAAPSEPILYEIMSE